MAPDQLLRHEARNLAAECIGRVRELVGDYETPTADLVSAARLDEAIRAARMPGMQTSDRRHSDRRASR